MIWFSSVVAKASVVGLKCPHCSKVQVRARHRAGLPIRCLQCSTSFSRARGEDLYRAWRSSVVRSRR